MSGKVKQALRAIRPGLLIVLIAIPVAGHTANNPGRISLATDGEPPDKLSEYGLFEGNGSTQQPAKGVVPYDIRSPLFSDYATKYRFVWMPPGTSAQYRENDVFEFPVGTILVKTFAYLNDLADPAKGRRLIETRLLIHRKEGWIGLPYVWNDEQTEAVLRIVGTRKDVRWMHTDGQERTLNYIVPNVNQCLGCHENRKVMRPIGPKARNLNKGFPYAQGSENQLTHWTKVGYLKGSPSPDQAP